MKNKYKHLIFATLILILCLIFFRETISLNKLSWGDKLTTYYPQSYLYKQSIIEHKDLIPLWNPYLLGGTPYWTQSTYTYIFNPLFFPLLMLFPPEGAINFYFIIGIFLAGLSMYILVFHITQNYLASLTSAIIYMFNGTIVKIITWSWMSWILPYALIPLIILFCEKYCNRENSKYLIIIGILLTIQIFSGYGTVFLYTLHIFAIYVIVKLFFLKTPLTFQKLSITFLLLSTPLMISFGLSAIKTLPVIDFMQLSTRGATTWEEMSKSRNLETKDIISRLTYKKDSDQIGIIGTSLLIFSFFKFKKYKFWIILCSVIIIISILMATGSPLMYLIWKYNPLFRVQRYLDRALIMWVFSASILVGIGIKNLIELFKNGKEM